MFETFRNRLGACSRNAAMLWAPGLATCIGLLVGCAPAVKPSIFVPREQVPLAGVQTGVAGWPQPDWWRHYQDQQLNRLMQMAMRGSPDIEVAQARYSAALRAADVQRAGLNPQATGLIDATAGYNKVATSGGQAGAPGSAQGLQLSPGESGTRTGLAGARLTWDLDLWGGQKAAIAAAVGKARAAETDRAEAANSLQYNLANTYFDWQALQARLALARQQERTAVRYRVLVAARVKAGLDNPDALDSANEQLAQQRQQMANLQGSAALDIAQLAALAGVSPDEVGTLHARTLPHPDVQLPESARLGLIARRPDIVASRWQIESSLRDIDQARAAFYPDVSLMALGAFLSSYPKLGSSTHTDLTLGSIGPSISLPIFSGGRLTAQLDTRQAELDSAVARYNQTVVQAARDVARDVLTLQKLDAMQAQQALQLGATRSQRKRASDRLNKGVADERPLLNARLQVDQQRDAQLQLQGQMLAANLSLIRSLGGGYHDDNLPDLPAATAKDASR